MVEDEIRELETRLLEPAVRASASTLDLLLADDFVEFGGSGRVFTKSEIIAALNAEPERSGTLNLEAFRALVLAQDIVLATYRCGPSLRSSLWRRERAGWRILFHQGTPSPVP